MLHRGWNGLASLAVTMLALPHVFAQDTSGGMGDDQNEGPRPKIEKQQPPVPDEEEGAQVELRFRDLQTFDDLVTNLIRPTELGALRLGKILPRPVTSLRFDALTLFPYVEEEVIYDSNVFLALDPSVTQDSVIFRTTVGGVGLVEFADGDGRLDVGWVSAFNNFTKNSSDFTESAGNANLSYKANQILFNVGMKFEERFNAVRIDVPGQRERDILTVYAKGTADLGDSLQFEGGYIWQNTEFKQALDAFLDSDQGTLYGTLGYRLGEGKRVFVEYAYLTQVYYEGRTAAHGLNDGMGQRLSVGAELTSGEGDEKNWSIVGSIGAQWVDYEDDKMVAPTAANPFDRNDRESDVIANLRGEILATERTTLSAGYRHLFAPSAVANFQIIDRFDVRADHVVNPALKVRGGLFYEAADPSISAPQGRKLDRWGIGVGMRYQFDPLVNVGIDYEYRQRNAGTPVGDYDVQRIALSISISL